MSGRFNLQDYATVDERITRYWAMHPKPEGSIQTEIIWVADDGSSVAIKATVYQGERILATGIAHEERLEGLDQYGKPLKGANTSSWWENAETSAIGRALANMDMSLSKNRPSRQEMEKAQRYEADEQQNTPARPSRSAAPPDPRPAAGVTAAGPPPLTPGDLLDTIRDDEADPKARKKALHDYYGGAVDIASLQVRSGWAEASGMPKDDLDKAWRWHHKRLAKELEPAAAPATPAAFAG